MSEPRRLRLPRPTASQVVQLVVGLGLAVALLGWGLPYFARTSWAEIWAVVRTVSLGQAIAFQLLMLLGLWFYTFTFTGSLPGLSHPRALILNLCGSSVSNLLPGGGAVGLAATFGICHSWGFSTRAISTSAIVTGVWNVLTRIALPVLAMTVLWADGTSLPRALKDAAGAGALTATIVLVILVLVIASDASARRAGHALDVLASWVRRSDRDRDPRRIEHLVVDQRARINGVVRTGWRSLTFGMVGFFGIYFVLFAVILRTTGVDSRLAILFGAFAIGRMLTAVGITPGGIGVTETATAAALVGWGADPAAATAGVVLFSLITHLMEVPLGGLGWLAWSVSEKSPRAAVADAD
jgi:uncharacterized membrane protein YbhN (UPF0104 family)